MQYRIIVVLLSCLPFLGTAQNASLDVISAGGDFSVGQQMQQSWTMGETVIETNTGQFITLSQGFQQSDLYRNLHGQVTYDNALHTVMNNTLVYLKQGTETRYQAITDNTGNFRFQSLQNGSYQLTGQCTKPWGGGNALDALVIMKHFTGISSLSGLRLAAADVNANGNINATDALQVMRRFVGLQNTFLLGDWVFAQHPVTVNGFFDLSDNFKGLCAGDVDGSYNPTVFKTEPDVYLARQGIIKLKNNDIRDIPVIIKDDVTMAAMSLVLKYPAQQCIINGVTVKTDNQNLVFNSNNGELRIAWYSLTPATFKAGDVLLTISLQLSDNSLQNNFSAAFESGLESQLADFTGNVLPGKTIEIPTLINDESGFYLGQNVPNPGFDQSIIHFSLPEKGKVILMLTDLLGNESKLLLEDNFTEGNYTYNLNCSTLAPGTYTYSMRFITLSGEYKLNRRLIVIH